MGRELKCGLMGQNIQENILKEKNKEKENLCGLIILIIKGTFMTTIFKEMENIFGQMVDDFKDHG